MKIRTDFVTNSSSSCFVTLRLTAPNRFYQFRREDDIEIDDVQQTLQQILSCKTTTDLLRLFGFTPKDLMLSSEKYARVKDIDLQYIQEVRIASGYKLYGAEAQEAIQDGEVDENSVTAYDGSILEGNAVTFNIKTKQIFTGNIDTDDGHPVKKGRI